MRPRVLAARECGPDVDLRRLVVKKRVQERGGGGESLTDGRDAISDLQ